MSVMNAPIPPALLLAPLLLLVACGCPSGRVAATSTPPDQSLETVARVLDGDTLELADGPERIRLRGVNTPEKGECGADEARLLLEELSTDGLVVERTGTGQRGRTLAHLFTAEGVHVQERLVAEGLAHVATYGEPDRFTDALRQAEDRAREGRSGIYGGLPGCAPVAPLPPVRVTGVDANPEGDDLAPDAGESVLLEGPPGLDLSGWTVKDTSASHRLELPAGTALDADGQLRVYTSCGEAGPGAVFWCMKGSAVWNNGGDTAFLLDPAGAMVSWLEY